MSIFLGQQKDWTNAVPYSIPYPDWVTTKRTAVWAKKILLIYVGGSKHVILIKV